MYDVNISVYSDIRNFQCDNIGITFIIVNFIKINYFKVSKNLSTKEVNELEIFSNFKKNDDKM